MIRECELITSFDDREHCEEIKNVSNCLYEKGLDVEVHFGGVTPYKDDPMFSNMLTSLVIGREKRAKEW